MFEENLGSNGPCGACDKMCNALCTMCLGILIFPLSLFVVGWNENNYVCESRRIVYAETEAQPFGCTSQDASEQFAFLSCPVVESSLKSFTPSDFNDGAPSLDLPVSFKSAASAQMVEMFQCVEECKETTRKNGAGQNVKVRRCSYKMGWSGSRVDSSNFHQDPDRACPDMGAAGGNPQAPSDISMGLSATKYAEMLQVGNHDHPITLNQELIERLTPGTPVELGKYASDFSGPPSGHAWERPLKISSSSLVVSGSYLKTCSTDALGCVRISYRKSAPSDLSVFTRVLSGGKTAPEPIPGGWACSGKSWQTMREGHLDKAEMVEMLHAENTMMTWVIRVAGVLLAWWAVYCCFTPFVAGADVLGDCINFLPCGGYAEDLLEGVVTWVVCGMSCGIGCSCALLVMGVVWVVMRPLVGGAILAVCGCCFGGAILVRSQVSGNKKGGHRLLNEP